ncbi:hypothetical protein Tco_1424937, partial [Tanacetum coccineum]
LKGKKDNTLKIKKDLENKLSDIDSSIDKGKASSATLEERLDILNNSISLEKMESIELAQKAKVKWSIEGDENSKFYHDIINKHRNNLAIRGIIVYEEWIEDPNAVKNEFLSHFRTRFDSPCVDRIILDMDFCNKLSSEQAQDLERMFSKEEIKGAVRDCELDKSPGLDGFTFGFYRRFRSLFEDEVVEAVNHFFNNGFCPKGGNSSFIALIPKTHGAKMVKDFRPISRIGSLYKIIAELLANRLVTILDGLVNEVQSAFIANRQILDGPFILNELKGGLGVSSFYALNRALIFKRVWRFHTQSNSLWAKAIKAFHGHDGKLGNLNKSSFSSNWIDIINALRLLNNKGIDLLGFIKKKVGNGVNTLFWEESWKGDVAFKNLFPRIYALETDKSITVADKMAQPTLSSSFRRNPRSGSEQFQMALLLSQMEGFILPNMIDRWYWSYSGDREYSVSSARNLIDDKTLGMVGSKTQWCKYVPIKVNILSWRIKLNNLRTRLNLSRRDGGM